VCVRVWSLCAVASGAEKSKFEVVRVRNVSTPAFPVTDQPGISHHHHHHQQQQQQQLARTTEVENIPQQLSVWPQQDLALASQR